MVFVPKPSTGYIPGNIWTAISTFLGMRSVWSRGHTCSFWQQNVMGSSNNSSAFTTVTGFAYTSEASKKTSLNPNKNSFLEPCLFSFNRRREYSWWPRSSWHLQLLPNISYKVPTFLGTHSKSNHCESGSWLWHEHAILSEHNNISLTSLC